MFSEKLARSHIKSALANLAKAEALTRDKPEAHLFLTSAMSEIRNAEKRL